MADLESHVDEVRTQMDEAAARALEKIGFVAERYAKKKCPVKTGRLKNSITHETDPDTVYIGTNVEYAPYVELGAKGRKPKAYLRPAMLNHIKEYEKILQNELGSGISIR